MSFVAGCARRSDRAAAATATPQPVEVTAVTRRDMAETLNLVGSVAANESATIRPETTGLVRSVHFEEGQRVQAGQVLMKIDDAELRAQLAQNEAAYRLAELNLQRATRLRETNINTEADFDRAQSEFAAAKSSRELSAVRLARTEIKAPFDGLVGARALSPGDYVTALSVVTTIDDLSKLKIDFQVPERFTAKVHQGTRFSVRSAALTGEGGASGEVYFVASVIDRATRSSEVKGFILGEARGLKPGMFANVELILDVRQAVLTVPEGAILTTTTGAQVVAVKDGAPSATAEFMRVRTGLRAKGFVEVTPIDAKLDESRQIVASGVGALILFPGAPITPRPLSSEASGNR